MKPSHPIVVLFSLLSFSFLFAVASRQPGGTIPPGSFGVYLPTISNFIPTETSTAVPTPMDTATPMTTATPLLYICDHDAYNCSDFRHQGDAQAVFEYCRDLGFGDIHRLDQNNDGIACNALPPLWVNYH